jgi:hypothetical protein
MQRQLSTVNNILGSGPKLSEQVVACDLRYDCHEKLIDGMGNKKRLVQTFIKRNGEGVFHAVKNCEKLEIMKYTIVQDEPYNYLSFEPFDGLINFIREDDFSPNIQLDNSYRKIIVDYILNSPATTFTLSDICSGTNIPLRSVTNNINALNCEGSINMSGGGKGRGHKTTFTVNKNVLQMKKEKPIPTTLDLDAMIEGV